MVDKRKLNEIKTKSKIKRDKAKKEIVKKFKKVVWIKTKKNK